MDQLTPATNPRLMPSPSVVAAEVDDEAVLLDLRGGIYYSLDSVGARIWTLLGDGAEEQMIWERLLEEYAVDPERLKSDLSTFLTELRNEGLLVPVDASPGY